MKIIKLTLICSNSYYEASTETQVGGSANFLATFGLIFKHTYETQCYIEYYVTDTDKWIEFCLKYPNDVYHG